MFIEVYAIPVSKQGTNDIDSIKTSENRRLIPINGIRIRLSSKCENRAELIFPNGDHIHVVGSYDEIVERIACVTQITRV